MSVKKLKSKLRHQATPKPCRPDGNAVYFGTKRHLEHRPPITDDTEMFFADLDRTVPVKRTAVQVVYDYDRETNFNG